MKTLLTACAGVIALSVSMAHAETGADSYNLVQKGRYLATVGDCTACHTLPGKPLFSGGVILDTPFGKLAGANITPDPGNGIGRWTFEDFQNAMSKGHGLGGKRLYGAMPYTAYTKVRREDNLAIFAYLKTVDASDNKVETNQLPFPFNVRTSLIGWNLLNFTEGEFKANPQKSEQWNRGAYLVEGLGHCGTCHTPKNLTGGDKGDQFLTGANLQHWVAPNITSSGHDGLQAWNETDIVQYLKTGANRFDIASGPMAEEVEHSSQHWSDQDLMAVAVYLKALAPTGDKPAFQLTPDAPGDERAVVLPQRIERPGAGVYASYCARCHGAQGEGTAVHDTPSAGGSASDAATNVRYPALAGNPAVLARNPLSVVRIVLEGGRTAQTATGPTPIAMPPFGGKLTAAQVSDVVSYVRGAWGNRADPVSPAAVQALNEALAP